MGTPWFWYRGNQGQYTVCADLASPDLAARHPLGHFLYGDFQREACQVLRGTGQLKPLTLPPSVFFDYPVWYARVLEPEVLMGRLGVAGWDGWDFDVGLWLPGLKPDDPGFWEGVYNFFGGIDWSSPWTWAYIAGGLAIGIAGWWALPALLSSAVGSIAGALTVSAKAMGIATAIAAKAATGAAIGAGLSYGLIGAATHDPGQAWSAAWRGALSGAVFGGISAGIAGLGGAAAHGIAAASIRATGMVSVAARLGGHAASAGIMMAGAPIAGYSSGLVGGLLSGASWGEAHRGALISAAVAGVTVGGMAVSSLLAHGALVTAAVGIPALSRGGLALVSNLGRAFGQRATSLAPYARALHRLAQAGAQKISPLLLDALAAGSGMAGQYAGMGSSGLIGAYRMGYDMQGAMMQAGNWARRLMLPPRPVEPHLSALGTVPIM